MLNISLKAETIFSVAGFPVTNAVLLAAVVLVFLAVVAITLKQKLRLVPSGL